MPHAAHYQFSAMSPTLSQLSSSSSCKFPRLQMAAKQQPDRAAWGRQAEAEAEADAAWACTRLRSCTSPALLLVRLLQLCYLSPFLSPLSIHMCVPRHHGRRCKTKQRRCDENLPPPSPCCSPTYINVFPNCELLPLARFTPILAFFGSSQTPP